jgi:hypothetical protein
MSFLKLIKIIGPAPNELPREDLFRKLSAERDRVRMTLQWFREHAWTKKISDPKPKKTGGKPASKPTTLLKNSGVTMQQLRLAAKMLEEGKL